MYDSFTLAISNMSNFRVHTLLHMNKSLLYSIIKEIGAVFYEAMQCMHSLVKIFNKHKKIANFLFKREFKIITKVMEELESSLFNVFDVCEEMPTIQSVKTSCNC